MENDEIGIQAYYNTYFETLTEATFEEIGVIYRKASQEIFGLEKKSFGEIEKDTFIEFEIKEIIKEQEYTIKRVLKNQELKKKRKGELELEEDDDDGDDNDNGTTEVTETDVTTVTEECSQNNDDDDGDDDEILNIEIYGDNGFIGYAIVSKENKINVPPSDYFQLNHNDTETKEIIILGNEDEWNHTIDYYELEWEKKSFAEYEEKEKKKQNTANKQWEDMGMEEMVMSDFSNEILPEC